MGRDGQAGEGGAAAVGDGGPETRRGGRSAGVVGGLDVLVLRLSSLGDVVLAGAVTGSLGRVGFVTEPQYMDVVSRFAGVEAVYVPSDTLPDGVRRVDLQHQPKSRWFGGARVERQDLRRWGRVWWKGPPGDPVVERYARDRKSVV